MDIKIYNLILEVTRRCNMNCAHCMRGDAQDMDADPAILPQIFNGIGEIETITFTGGEPALNTQYIKTVVDYIIEHHIPVHGCFIATNAKVYSQELVDCVWRLYDAYCGDGDVLTTPSDWLFVHDDEERQDFSIAISGDRYHENVPSENIRRYYRCGFFSKCKLQVGSGILARGRGASIPGSYVQPVYKLNAEVLQDENQIAVDQLYVSCNGSVVADCDLSFADIDAADANQFGYLGTIGKERSLHSILTEKLGPT